MELILWGYLGLGQIYFISQASNGYERLIFNYDVAPNTVNTECWSLGDKYYDGDVWTCDYTIDKFKNILKEYDYIVINKADNNFTSKYHELFEDKDLQRMLITHNN